MFQPQLDLEDLETVFGKREWEDETKEPALSVTKPEEESEKTEPISLVEPIDSIEDRTETKNQSRKDSDSGDSIDEINEEDLND